MSGPWRLTNRVQAARTARGWTQAELARRAGVSRAEVSAIETGRSASPSTGAALALGAALGLAVEELFVPAGAPAPAWAWPPRLEAGARFWRADVGGCDLLFPVEPTPLGTLAHDGVAPAPPRAGGPRTVVVAGCDPAVGVLAAAVARAAGVRVLALTRPSGRALELLAQGRVHLAGVHLGDNARAARRARRRAGAGPWPADVARWEARACRGARRAGADGPRGAARAAALGRPRGGSGARRLVERLSRPRARALTGGLGRAARDHAGVAEAIRCGWAQLGPCVRLAAEQAGLDFLPVERQAYDLCTTAALRDDPAVAAVLEALAAAPLRRLLGELPGYDAADAGRVEEVA
ncbi:MAG: helix-turn-helix domain-containing protein [Planctomycetes bacterium]|nr:helix-turn-helix domain-containing protein [Planctomycetota bacterium]